MSARAKNDHPFKKKKLPAEPGPGKGKRRQKQNYKRNYRRKGQSLMRIEYISGM